MLGKQWTFRHGFVNMKSLKRSHFYQLTKKLSMGYFFTLFFVVNNFHNFFFSEMLYKVWSPPCIAKLWLFWAWHFPWQKWSQTMLPLDITNYFTFICFLWAWFSYLSSTLTCGKVKPHGQFHIKDDTIQILIMNKIILMESLNCPDLEFIMEVFIYV